MLRFFLARVFVDPVEGWVPSFFLLPESRPNINNVSGGWTSVALGLQFGQVGFKQEMLAPMQADPNMILFDEWPLGITWASVPTARRTQIRDAVNAMGLSFQHQTGYSIRQVLDLIVAQIAPGMSCESLNVQDLDDVTANKAPAA